MNLLMSKLPRLLLAGLLASGGGLLATGPSQAFADDAHTCSGTGSAPGVLTGSHGDVQIKGFCVVNAGVADVENLTLEDHAVLIAAFALNDSTHSGVSRLRVHHDLHVGEGATLFLGCLATSSPCLDDPNPSNPTLNGPARVGGDLSSDEPLAVIVHDVTVGGSVVQEDGGGGFTCKPKGPFAMFGSPVFSAYEDSSIGGDLRISGMKSCWLGVIRNHIAGDASFTGNHFADRDAIEIIDNHIGGDLACADNSMVWDGHEISNHLYPRVNIPNTVGDDRSGQCVLSSKTSKTDQPGPEPF